MAGKFEIKIQEKLGKNYCKNFEEKVCKIFLKFAPKFKKKNFRKYQEKK